MKTYNRIGLTAGLVAIVASACVDPDSPLIEETAEGCDEFQPGANFDNVDVRPQVRAYMQAASDFSVTSDRIAHEVLTACSNVATDLGAENTWSGLDDIDDALSNSQGTGACDAAGNEIEAILLEAETVNATIALAISKGACHPDFDAQARCDAECAANAQCDPGTVVTRCEPGSLSVVCAGSCQASATCMGTPERPANCMGECESECVGMCHGPCVGEDGQVTENDPNCRGKCAAACNGTCRGRCKVDIPEGVQCGAEVACVGGCAGEFTAPSCTSEFTPPQCQVDVSCHAACSAAVMANAPCDPTHVEIFAEVDPTTPRVALLVDTLEANLPILIDAAEQDGRLVLDAADRLGESGDAIRGNVDDLDGKSLACLGESSTAVADTIGMLDASVNASVDVTLTTSERMQ